MKAQSKYRPFCTSLCWAVLIFVSFFSFSNSYSQTSVPFSYTGAVQTFVVPCGVTNLSVKAWGGGGSGGGSDSYGGAVGGAGAFIETTIPVTAGETLTLIVGGGAGPGGNCAGGAPGGTEGWGNGIFDGGQGGNSGTSGCSGGGGGGGAGSGILRGSNVLLVAGGGGGGSGGGQNSSGATGGGGGVDGNIAPGSCSSAGIAGASTNGNGLVGLNKGAGDGAGGGGGGGGYFGGSGGGVANSCDCGACGGGGGTSFSSGSATTIANGNGQSPGNSTDSDLPAGVAIGGGTSTKGGDGYIVITYEGGNPESDFLSTTVCSRTPTTFTNNSITSDGTITSVVWDYGDGSPTDTVYSPSHIYDDGGTYTVTLITTNSFICKDTVTKTVNVYYSPTALFSANDVCLGDSVQFTNTSTINSSSSITSYNWLFGDNTSGTQQNPAHLYTAGTYTVSLVPISNNMCVDTATTIVNTFDPPIAAFSVNNVCLINAAQFVNTSTEPSLGAIATSIWSFGDGTPNNSSTQNPQHTYATPGNYTVTLISISNNLACADTQTNMLTIYPMPVADYTAQNVCKNETVTFNDTSTVSTGTIATWLWNFGDNTPTSNTQSPTHTYTTNNTFTTTLIVTTNNGCKDTMTKQIIIYPIPTVEFFVDEICDGDLAYFTDASTVDTSSSVQYWQWNFGDNTPMINTENAEHQFADTGSYNVQLIAISNFGCADSITKLVTVKPNPVVTFTSSDTVGCNPLCVNFQSNVIINGGTVVGYLWTYGDSEAFDNTPNGSYCYSNTTANTANPQALTFDVSLTVTSDGGCVTVVDKQNHITVFPTPEANFSVSPQTALSSTPVINIENASLGDSIWHWNFGDLDTSIVEDPQFHSYADTGSFTISLIASNQYNCKDTAKQTVIIEPDFLLYIPTAFTPNGDLINDSFMFTGTFVGEFELTIYDRWGALIYKTNDAQKPWNGSVNNGTETPKQDVYVYALKAKDLKKKVHSYKGTVTLVR